MKFVQRGLSVLLVLALLMSGMALQGWAEAKVETPTQRIARIYVLCDTDIVVAAKPEPQAVPTDMVHVMAHYVQPDDGTVIPDELIPLEKVNIPEKMLFDKVNYTEVPVTYTVLYAGDAEPTTYETSFKVHVDLTEPYPARLRIISLPERLIYVDNPNEEQPIYTEGLKVVLVNNDAHYEQPDVTDDLVIAKKMKLQLPRDAEGRIIYGVENTIVAVEMKYYTDDGRVLKAYFYVEVLPEARLDVQLLNPPTDTRYFKASNPQTIDTNGMRVLASYGYIKHDEKHGDQKVVLRTDVIDVSNVCKVDPVVLNTIGRRTIIAKIGEEEAVQFEIIVDDAELALFNKTKDEPVKEGKTVLHKVPFLVPYRLSPLELSYTCNGRMKISQVEWQLSEHNRLMRIQDGKITMRGLFAGAGKVTLVVTDNHGGVHTAETRVVLYKMDLILRLFFGKYI